MSSLFMMGTPAPDDQPESAAEHADEPAVETAGRAAEQPQLQHTAAQASEDMQCAVQAADRGAEQPQPWPAEHRSAEASAAEASEDVPSSLASGEKAPSTAGGGGTGGDESGGEEVYADAVEEHVGHQDPFDASAIKADPAQAEGMDASAGAAQVSRQDSVKTPASATSHAVAEEVAGTQLNSHRQFSEGSSAAWLAVVGPVAGTDAGEESSVKAGKELWVKADEESTISGSEAGEESMVKGDYHGTPDSCTDRAADSSNRGRAQRRVVAGGVSGRWSEPAAGGVVGRQAHDEAGDSAGWASERTTVPSGGAISSSTSDIFF